MTIAVYAGTFDPITNGHHDIIESAARSFDQVIVAVAADNNKNTLFSLEERTEMVKIVAADFSNVIVESFHGLLVDFAKEKGSNTLVRGLRMVSDFEYEMQMALFNKDLSGLDTAFFIAGAEHSFISSSQVRNVASLGGAVQPYVHHEVAKKLYEKYGK